MIAEHLLVDVVFSICKTQVGEQLLLNKPLNLDSTEFGSPDCSKSNQITAGQDHVPPEKAFVGFGPALLFEFLHVQTHFAPRVPYLRQKVFRTLRPRGNGQIELF